MVALLGPSGMGKSTFLQLLAGVMRPSAGEIHIGDVALNGLNEAGLRRFAPATSFRPAGHRSEPVALCHGGAKRVVHPAGRPVPCHRNGHQRTARTPRSGQFADRAVGGLPKGTQQIVALAAGVAAMPRLLLADEPTNQLDSTSTVQVIDLLRLINAQLGTTIVLVTHDPVVAAALPRTVTVRDGRVGAEGRHGLQYAVMDATGTIQMPPEVRQIIPPLTRFIVGTNSRGSICDPRAKVRHHE